MLKVLWVALVLFSASSWAQEDLPRELFLFGTYRDFLPAACLLQVDPDALSDAWSGVGSMDLPEIAARCNQLLDDPVWEKALLDGNISGHPDFEARGFADGQDFCNTIDPEANLFFPKGSCIFTFNADGLGFKHSTVGRTTFVGQNGIPKPNYCDDSEGGETSCGDTTQKPTTTKKKFFDSWYSDDATFNKRVGHRLLLNLESSNGNQYVFNSAAQITAVDFPSDDNRGFYGPLDMFKKGGSCEINISTTSPEDAPAWPQSHNGTDQDLSRGFWTTTELHTTFEFRSDAEMKFTFSGDDDFWAYINGQLTVDVGGTHGIRTQQVDLNEIFNGRTIAGELGLADGEVYTLDIFHAERQTSNSNFRLETSLFAACNVVQSGKSSFDFISEANEALRSKFLLRGMTINDDNSITLQKSTDVFSSSLLFSTQEQNVLRGFDAKFNVTVSKNKTIGFAFVLQSAGINDFPLFSGEGLNIDGLQKSLAIVFDLCVDRGSNDCKDQEVRLHHADNATEGNSPRDATKRVNDRILRNVKRDEAFPVQIIYFGGRPDFLEVYVNNSLYLRQDNFGQIIEDLEIGGAHVGFTSTSTNIAADITIENFNFTTVQVEPSLTQFIFNSSAEAEVITADGLDVSEGIQIKTFDFCGNQLEAGTLQALVDAFYIEKANENGEFVGETANNEQAEVFDNGDGTYQIALRTEVPGNYSLVVAFGEGCKVQFTDENVPNLTLPDGDNCFYAEFNNGSIVSEAFPPEIPPTASPIEFVLNDDNDEQLVLISSIAGGIVLLGLCAAVAFFGFYRKWNRKKGYVKDGNMYRLDLNTTYTGNNEYKETGRRLLETQQEILALQATGQKGGREQEIEKLKDANDQMRAIIRQNKAVAGVQVPKSHVPKSKGKKKAARTEF